MAITNVSSKVDRLGIMTFTAGNRSTLLQSDAWSGYDSIAICAPATLAGTVTVEALPDPDSDETADASWRGAQSPPGTDITIAADKAVVLTAVPFPAIRLSSTGTETATFFVIGHRQHGR